MKGKLFFLVFAFSVLAQAQTGSLPVACGPGDESFKVRLDHNPPAAPPLEPGKARIYFIHDAHSSWPAGYPTSPVAMDGKWLGANHGDSYFFVSIEPGEHHLCAALQSSIVDQSIELAHFTAEAGKTYYYRTRLILSRSVELMELEPIDGDQGSYLIASYALSVSKHKK